MVCDLMKSKYLCTVASKWSGVVRYLSQIKIQEKNNLRKLIQKLPLLWVLNKAALPIKSHMQMRLL